MLITRITKRTNVFSLHIAWVLVGESITRYWIPLKISSRIVTAAVVEIVVF